MNNQTKKWEVINKSKTTDSDSIIKALLKNREIKSEEEFFNPIDALEITPKSLGINAPELKKAIERIAKAFENKELVFIYGDYDADGITATAIMWEALHSYGINVLPHIPDRFEEGYGINASSVKKIKDKNPNLSLIVTVDNGIVAYEGIKEANNLGIDVIVIDHHVSGTKKLASLATIHTTLISGSGLSWIFTKELLGKREIKKLQTLELAAIGTIADQLPLVGPNRSIVKYGLAELNKTKRPGLKELFEEAGVATAGFLTKIIGAYEVGFIIAPRINAMGRLKHGIESLRLICTRDRFKAREIAKNIGSTNFDRQKIVEEVVIAARKNVTEEKIIVIANESYHEGVIGLAAGRIVEEFYRPAIVLSVKGDISKASARSISGFNIIEAIRSLESLYIEGGGHTMAAGFSIKTENIDLFTKEINKYAAKILTDEILERKLKIDLELNFNQVNFDLEKRLKEFEPVGLGNPTPTFVVSGIEVVDAKPVGRDSKHLKLRLRQDGKILDAIFFGGGEYFNKVTPDSKIDAVFQIEENVWNSHMSLQLKIKDLKLSDS